MSHSVRALAAAFLLASQFASPSAPAAAERPAVKTSGAPAAHRIAHESYRLDNGLTVILREDHARPVVVVNLWYGVGSKDEPPGRSGFAHLFEHLMFMGTERAPGGDFDQIMEAGGGWNNASTSYDRTNYYSTGPSSLLPTLLWLDADRLEDLGRMMTQEKLDKQREVVRNERRQSAENRPYGMADLAIDAEMFPKGHPYHDSVIGTHEDLQAATVADVKDFFATFYVPSNASLVVAGDFNPAEIKPLIARLFGTLPSRPVPPQGTAAPVRLESVKRLTMVDDVQLNRVTMSWHSPRAYAPGDADLDVLAGVLATGKSSRLWQRLVRETELCADVSAWQDSREVQSIFEIEATCPPSSSLDEIEKIIDEEVARLREKGPTEAEVARVRNTIERAKLDALDSLLGVADQLNAYQTSLGRPDALQWDLDRLAKATPGTVRSWARQVADPGRRLIIRVVGEDPRARPEASAASTPFTFPRPETWTLGNGLTVQLWRRPELPLVSASLLLPRGAAGDRGKSGLTSLALDMLDEGTGTLSAAEFADALEALGASMSASASRESSSATLGSLSRTFPEAFSLWTNALTAPALAEAEFESVKALRLDDLRQREDDPMQLARLAASRSYFGDQHPLGLPVDGLVPTVERLDLPAVRQRLQEVMRPGGATLLVAGDIDRATLEPLVAQRLGGWAPSGAQQAPEDPEIPARYTGPFRVFLVPRPGAVQTVLAFIWPGVARGAEDRLALEVANTPLGGSFTSRLNQNLRETHGYTYGASSSVATLRTLGWMSAGSPVRADVTGDALRQMLKELDAVAAGSLTPEERNKAIESAKNERVSSTEGLDGLLGTAAQILSRGETFEAFDSESARLDALTLEQLNAAAKAHVLPRAGVLVLVGDEALVREQVKGLELPPLEVLANPAGGC